MITIITINYNNATGLQNTIQSVLEQSYLKFEYLVIDGGSTDKSIDIIKQYGSNISRYVSEPDHGIYDAMNKGIEMASGQYLMFLNSGDVLGDKDVLQLCTDKIVAANNVDIFYGDMWGFNDSIEHKWMHKHPSKLTLEFLEQNNINHQSSLIKKSLFDEYGLYPLQYKLAGDHWLYLKCLVNQKQFHHIAYPLVTYDYSGVSGINRQKYLNEMQQMWEVEVPGYYRELLEAYKKLNVKRNKILTNVWMKFNKKVKNFKHRLKNR